MQTDSGRNYSHIPSLHSPQPPHATSRQDSNHDNPRSTPHRHHASRHKRNYPPRTSERPGSPTLTSTSTTNHNNYAGNLKDRHLKHEDIRKMLRSRLSSGLVAAARAEVRVAPRAAVAVKMAARSYSRPSARAAMLAPVCEWLSGMLKWDGSEREDPGEL